MTTPLIPKRKLDPDDRTLLNFIEALPDSPTRRIHANDDQPVLTLDQDGSGSNLLLESSVPELRYAETDKIDPAGRYRTILTGGTFSLEKATAAGWAASQAFVTLDPGSRKVIYESPDDGGDDWYTELAAGGAVGETTYVDVGSSGAARKGFNVVCGNGSSSDLTRLTISTGLATVIASWGAVQHKGTVLRDLNCVWISELTIASGAVTRTGIFHHIDTQSNNPSDNLDTINGGSAYDLLIIQARHTDRTVVVKHGTGNIQLKAGVDISLDTTEKVLLLFYNGTSWMDIGGGISAADYVAKTLFDANTILKADTDDTPVALTVAEQRLVGRITSGNIDDLTGAQALTILTGQAGAAFSWNSQNLTNTGTITAATSVWHHEHDLFASSLTPGASGATRTAPDSNTIGGWQLNAAGETLYFEAHMEAEWDATSDLIINAWWEVNVDNTGGAGGDTVDLRMVVRYKGEGDTAIKTQTVEVATTVGASARYKQFKTTFTIDYDAASNVIDSLDILSFALNLETDTSEVDDIILNLMELRYATTKPSLEA